MNSKEQVLRLPDVLNITGVCRATIYNWIDKLRNVEEASDE